MTGAANTLVREPESTLVIRFQDCDPFGHLNNARYIDYFMDARMDHLMEHYAFNMFEHGKTAGASWVVTKTQIAYLLPAVPGETVRIGTRLIYMDESRIVIEGVMSDSNGKRLKAISWVEFVYVSMTSGRPTRHDVDLLTLFQQVLVEVEYQPDSFNARVETLKQLQRTRTTASHP
ncbi:MAG: acyl-CoA thioesterase [Anaerolineae bacterium]|nr:acyl-CoA thioesterase [Anaerolineae bacterium]